MVHIHWIDGFPTDFVAPAYSKPDGEVERIVSHHPVTKAMLSMKSAQIYGRARFYLEARRGFKDEVNRAFIAWETPAQGGRTSPDHRIHLAVAADVAPSGNDARDAKLGNRDAALAAQSIEYGHVGKGGVGGSLARFQKAGELYKGKWILHDASGLTRSARGVH